MKITETDAVVYGRCVDFECPGAKQVIELPGLREEIQRTLADGGVNGSDPLSALSMQVVETSVISYRAADPEARCGHCNRRLEVTDQDPAAMRYETLSGHAQDGLLRIKKLGIGNFDPQLQRQLADQADQAEPRRETPLEALQLRFVRGEIELPEFEAKRAVLNGGTSAPADADEELPEGVRRKDSGSYQAYARVGGEQRTKVFPTRDAAAEQAAAWRAEREAV